MITHYDWTGGREAMWRFGPDTGPVVVAALPLFEEANRTRTFVVTVLRMLAERGIAGALPDLPGQGESVVPTEDCTLDHLRQAFAAACAHLAPQPCHVFAIRSGALLDDATQPVSRCYLTPHSDAELARELGRLANASRDNDTSGFMMEIAGNRITRSFYKALSQARMAGGAPLRIIRLASDTRPANHKIDGPPLWRRAEPDNDPAFAARIVDDIAQWVRACEA